MNIQDLIRDNVKAMKPYSSARDEYKDASENMIFLDANENPYENGMNRYPDPQQNELKVLLSKKKIIPTSNILLGNGSDEVLDLIFRAFCEPNRDNIITLPPTYGMYEVLANVNAVEVIKVELSENFQPKVNSILEAATPKTKILFLCSPNNPTGNSFNHDAVNTLLSNFHGIVVIDEAYIDFSEEKSWIENIESFPNLIVTQTLSKAYGMAGIRLGICYASQEIISVLNKIKPPYNVNALTQQRAIDQLSKRNQFEDQVEAIKKGRAFLEKTLPKIDIIKKTYPSDSNFILLKVDNANKRYNQFIKKGIVIRNRTTQPLCEDCIRITVGTENENRELIRVLESLI